MAYAIELEIGHLFLLGHLSATASLAFREWDASRGGSPTDSSLLL